MPDSSDLARIIDDLRNKRQQYVDAIAELDELFNQYGIKVGGTARRRRGRRPGRPNGSTITTKKAVEKKATKKKTGRKKFRVSGEQVVLNFVKNKRGATTAQINALWRQQGRGGNVGNILTKFVQNRVFKRAPVKDGRGSRYTVA